MLYNFQGCELQTPWTWEKLFRKLRKDCFLKLGAKTRTDYGLLHNACDWCEPLTPKQCEDSDLEWNGCETFGPLDVFLFLHGVERVSFFIVNPMSATLKDAKNHKNPILEHGRSSSWNVFNSGCIFEIQKTPIFFINKALDPSLRIEKNKVCGMQPADAMFHHASAEGFMLQKISTPL